MLIKYVVLISSFTEHTKATHAKLVINTKYEILNELEPIWDCVLNFARRVEEFVNLACSSYISFIRTQKGKTFKACHQNKARNA